MQPTTTTPSPHWADYVILTVFLVICMGIGIFFGRRRQESLESYFLGNRKLQMIPVALSLFVTFASSISLMGTPTEVYMYGSMFCFVYIGVACSQVLASVSIVPLIYPLRLTSINEYLQKRFDSNTVRIWGTLLGMLQTIIYMGVTLYGPGLALQTVVGIPFWLSVVVIGVIGTLYTSIGGIKSVVWTDVFQCAMIFTGLAAVCIKGCLEIGNIQKIWSVPNEGGRMIFDKISLDPTERHTIWGLVIGAVFTRMGGWCNQSSIQRVASMKTLKDAKRSFYLNVVITLVFGCVLTFLGFISYTYYNVRRCDPLESGAISNLNQLIPFFVFDLLQGLPGLSGLFLSCLFSGSLSTLSSGINALATNTVEDLMKNFLERTGRVSATVVAKVAVLLYGALSIWLAFMMQFATGPITQVTMSFFGACGGPLAGLFFLGGMFPTANWIGAIVGSMIALVFNLWIGIGSRIYGTPSQKLPPNPIDGCFVNNTPSLWNHSLYVQSNSSFTLTTFTGVNSILHNDTVDMVNQTSSENFMSFLYNMSYLWYGLTGFALTIIIGVLVSCLTGFNRGHCVEPNLIMPFCRRFWGLTADRDYSMYTYQTTNVSKKTNVNQKQNTETEAVTCSGPYISTVE